MVRLLKLVKLFMLPFENMIADYVKETENHVLYRVTPIFDGDNLLARGVQIEAESVEDNGKGILPDVLERIFVPFFTTKKNGSGIGLSLCKQIVMNHGGEISVESEDGRGTAVEIKL